MTTTDATDQARQTETGSQSNGLLSGYKHGEERPLASYGLLTAVFGILFGGFLARNRRHVADRVAVGDVLLLGAATHKLGRLVAKDRVTSFVRAPFTRYTGEAAIPGEVSEEPRGRGMRLAIGELLVCPYCMGQWIVAAFFSSLVKWPGMTRLVASVFAALGISDFLQLAFKASERKALG